MPQLLISVRNGDEARIASEFPIGIVDAKDPDAGALGQVAPDELKRISDQCGPQKTQSVALGELADYPAGSDPGWNLDLFSRFRFAKIGLARMARVPDWPLRWQSVMRFLPDSVCPVGVAYVDSDRSQSPPIDQVLELVLKRGSKGALLLDTFDKTSGDTLSLLGAKRLAEILAVVRKQKGVTVVAGSVHPDQLKTILACHPDYVGVRGAVCHQGRAMLDRNKLAALCQQFCRANNFAKR